MRALYTWGCAAAIWLVASLTASAQTLSIGMSGSEVSSLQNDLVAAGYLARTVDGDYGSTTKEAVALFQKAKGLPVTGRADDDTRAAIERAAGAGYLKGGIDGVYGEDTTNAVRAFQKAKGIPVSGVIDEMTYGALRNEDTSSVSYEGSGEEEGSGDRGSSLYSIGDSGSDVSSIQRKLKKMGYLDGAVDGIYGGDTASAVKAFQSDEGLSVTGMVNGDTLSRITSEYAAQSGETVLSLGDSGKKVIRLQNKLLLHGYNPGSVDGIYGEGTAEAVRQLQAEENLARTGIADGDVWDRLDSAPRFTGNYKKVFRMEATAYTPNDGDGRGMTAMGAYAGKGHAAVDPNIIPLGSEVYIEGYGYAICDDIGGAIHGNIIDVGVDNYDQAYKWGMKPKVNVYLIR